MPAYNDECKPRRLRKKSSQSCEATDVCGRRFTIGIKIQQDNTFNTSHRHKTIDKTHLPLFVTCQARKPTKTCNRYKPSLKTIML